MITRLTYNTYVILLLLLSVSAIVSGIIAIVLNNNIICGVATFLFGLSFIVSLIKEKKSIATRIEAGSIQGKGECCDMKESDSEMSSHFRNIENYLDTSVRDKMQVIPVLTEQLQTVINQTDEAAGGLIQAFMGISKQAKKQLASVQDLFGSLSEQTTDNNILFQTQENLKEIQANFSMMTSFFDNSISMITEVVSQLTNVDAFALNIENVQKMTNILALNASIQAAHSGKAGAGFKVIATEINTLSRKSNDSIREITDITENLTSKVNAIKSELESVYQKSKSIGLRTNELFNMTTSKISSTLEETAEKIKNIANDAENLTKDISKVVVSIQFQDITRQKIEHVISPLQIINNDFIESMEKLKKKEFNFIQNKENPITESLMKQYTMESEREIFNKVNNRSS